MLIYIIRCYFGSGHMEIILTESVKQHSLWPSSGPV